MTQLLGSGVQLGQIARFARQPVDVNANWIARTGQDVLRTSYPNLSNLYPVGSISAAANTALSNVPASSYGATNGTLFVIPGAAGTTAIQTSPDGVVWTNRTTPSVTITSIIWTGVRFIASCLSGQPLYSPDGVTWTATTGGPSVSAIGQQCLAYSASLGLTVCLGNNNVTSTTNIYTLADGSTAWTAQTCPASLQVGVCWTGTYFLVSLAENTTSGAASLLRSSNSTSWTTVYPGIYSSTAVINNLPIVSNGSGVVVMPNCSNALASFWVSTNHGANWQIVKLPPSVNLNFNTTPVGSGAYENGRFVFTAPATSYNNPLIFGTTGFDWAIDPAGTVRGAGVLTFTGVLYNAATGKYLAWNTTGSNMLLTESATTFYIAPDTSPSDATILEDQSYIRAT